ncbi:MAG TPA: penicillin-binding protein 2 [Phycisphaerae bacterium]|jgi:cell division protein FtsI/penicillin-binding protein 2
MDALKRTQLLAGAVLISTAGVLTGLLGRVAWIERHVSADMGDRLSRQHTAVIPLTANREAMLFADGTPAAMSVRVFNMFADPAFIMDPDDTLNPLSGAQLKDAQKRLVEALAPLVNKSPDDLKFEIEDNAYYKQEVSPGIWEDTDKPRRFLWLAREVDENFYARFVALKEKLKTESQETLKADGHNHNQAVRTAAAEKAAVLYHTLDGIGFVRSMKRVYPMGDKAGSVIGFANRYEGIDGLEHQLDPMLKGIDGKMFVTKDAQRHTLLVQDQRYTAADNGRSVWLTLDTVIQGIAEDQLKQAVTDHKAASGTAIVMDPYTGKILAMANYPSFDPAKFAETDADIRRNRAVTDPYEPGSIWKPFVMAWAIEKGIVKPTDIIDCRQGTYVDPTGRVVRDTHGVGSVPVSTVLVQSSNIGMTQIGWKMGIPTLYEGITRFGFGKRTGAELPGDQGGIVKPLSQWNKGTMTSASFGYEVAATPLQLLRAYCTFANGGYLVTPRVINAVEDVPGRAVPWTQLAPTPVAPQIISTQTAQTMREILRQVIVDPHGTGHAAASKMYDMFGKTGTAHVAAGSHGTEGHGYGSNDYDSSFLVGAPFSNPKLVAVVTLHNPKNGYYGGTVSAPAAVAIMERSLMYMQVGPDLAPPPVPARRVAAH